jgi:DNA-binding NarL/FixJ family response regulator
MLRARPVLRGEDLTAREREVLGLVMLGLANKQIARELQITDGTVKSHIGSIFTRIGVTDRTSAALWAERNLRHLVTPATGRDAEPWPGRGAVLQSATA